jgi:hypothetical protein
MLDKFEKYFAGAITAIVLLSLAFVGGRLTKDCEKSTVKLQPRFTIDSVEDIKVKDSIVTKIDTFTKYDTLKIYQDYFRAREYNLTFSNNITGSATVSENTLDSINLDDNLLEQNKNANTSLSIGVGAIAMVPAGSFGPSINVQYGKHSVMTAYNFGSDQFLVGYHLTIF